MSKVRVLNPFDNTEIFGMVPPLTLTSKTKGVTLTRAAPIYLTEGRHFGPNGGFGVAHIWAEHKTDIVQAGFASIGLVPAYLQEVLTAPSKIYFEDRILRKPRVNAVRIATGTVILEYYRTIIDKVETPHWSVITAYSKPRKAGVLVGQI
jgi:hypothetical protein